MRALVLGAGLQGSAAALDLCRSEGVDSVRLVDGDQGRLDGCRAELPDLEAEFVRADLSRAEQVSAQLAGMDACLCALPYFLIPAAAAACADAGAHFVDLGGNPDARRAVLALDARAKASGATLVPDCGLAPGLAATASMAAIDGFELVDALRIRVGGLPRDPLPPLDYSLVFSVHGLINEYMGEAVVLREGEIVTLPTLAEVERLEFPPPAGGCEAFLTLGGVSTLPWSLKDRVRNLDYKTVRYPGHARKIRLLKDLGFFSEKTVELEGARFSPRALSALLLADHLRAADDHDLVVFRVDAEGMLDGKRRRRRYEMIDFYDETTGLSAMRRCTAFPASVVLQMLARGEGPGPGARVLEFAVDAGACLAALAARGLDLRVELADLD